MVLSTPVKDNIKGKSFQLVYLVRVVGEINFVKDLRRFVLDGFHFHLMGRILSLAVPQRLLQPLKRVSGNGMTTRPQE